MVFSSRSSVSPEKPIAPRPEPSVDPDGRLELSGELTPVEADRAALAALEATRTKEAATSDAHFLEPAAGEAAQDPLLLKTEGVLEAGLEALLGDLTPEQRATFTATGKELAETVFLKRQALKGDDVVKLVQHWLHALPGVNKAYLSQEALLKTLALMQMFKQESSLS